MGDAPKASSAKDAVLVVEHDESLRRSLQGVLARQGYDVSATGSTLEAVEIATKTLPAAVVLADRIPATEATACLKALDDADLDSAVIVTAVAGPMERVFEMLRLGSVDFLRKPLTPEALMTAVGRAVAIGTRRRIERTAGKEARAKNAIFDQVTDGTAPVPPALAVVLGALDAGTVQIPAVPAVVHELRRAIRDPKTSLDGLAALIQRDQSLALNVLRMSNSAAFARGARNNDLKAAVGRIGFKQVESLVETVFLHQCYQPRDARFQEFLGELWRRSLAVAISMRILAETLGRGTRLDPSVAYVTGLLCDVGASFLLWLVSERAPQLDPRDCFGLISERHESVGSEILSKWDLDPAAVQVASSHHAQSPSIGASLYWSLAAIATELADREVGRRDITRRTRRGTAFVGRCAEELRITEGMLRKAADQLAAEYQSAVDVMS